MAGMRVVFAGGAVRIEPKPKTSPQMMKPVSFKFSPATLREACAYLSGVSDGIKFTCNKDIENKTIDWSGEAPLDVIVRGIWGTLQAEPSYVTDSTGRLSHGAVAGAGRGTLRPGLRPQPCLVVTPASSGKLVWLSRAGLCAGFWPFPRRAGRERPRPPSSRPAPALSRTPPTARPRRGSAPSSPGPS